ncbi:chitin synthase chs-2-like [Onthophagus taurus]|uniref:chitin synthase chs-2-like n=1 Tax=Onthophagus taurus TaxID=166361 RepID=UPI0039BDA5C9
MTYHFHSSNQAGRNDDKWDVFEDPLEILDTDSDQGNDKWKGVQKVTKLLICIITFFVVLIGCVICKASLLFVTAHLNRKPKLYCHENGSVADGELGEFVITLSEEEVVTWMWILVFIYFVPQLATFLRSSRILLFKKCLRISYAIPLHLSGVVTTLGFLILSLENNNNIKCDSLQTFPSYLFLNNPNVFEIEDIWLIFMGLFLLGSYIMTTCHIYIPQNKVLASTEKLYVRPYYDPFLIDQDLAMNRRLYNKFLDIENVSNSKENVVPMLYVCGTMWHETKDEMLTFLKSIIILDEHHCLTRIGNYFNKSINYYRLESHIVFDDAFTKTSQRNQEAQMNDFVKELINSVDNVASLVYNNDIKLKDPVKYVTPYGGKLEWILPGKTKLVVHLKDNNKVRSRKRWSQVMYMYYILGHRIIERNDLNNTQKELEAENTYILSVDGDIHFRPKGVEMLLEQMKRDKTLGAACGRVHPVGKGIFAWYQKFEYAISYWLYKASENITGCVLCCPGCFTIYRGSAIMSILKKLKIRSSKAVHFMKFDHGEDRWISVLLALCGYKVGYVASADACTNCPESFGELYNQRRRWIPSTTANITYLTL